MKRLYGALSFLGVLLLVSCAGGLPPSLQREIGDENSLLQSDEQQLQHSRDKVQQELAQAPDLFSGQSEPDQWMANYGLARTKLSSAKADAQQLAGVREEVRARRLLAEERALRQAAETTWKAQEAAAGAWLAFRRDLPTSLAGMNREYQTIHTADLTQLSKTIAQAEKDWPAKSSDLENRLAIVKAIPAKAEEEWSATAAARQDAAAGKADAKQVAVLIKTDELLSQQAKAVTAAPAELAGLSAQLYDTWDKILTDLDESHYGGDSLYRERLKTVRTHYTNVAAKKTETHSEEHWVTVSEPSFEAVKNDMGMAIAHKDAGHFDSEATTIPQPPGYSYIASPEQGSNQYGYWTHDNGGHSIWTWLPEYLILRELLWNHDYHPVVMGDYSAYRMAQRNGTSYYGQQTPNSPPKYGSHGTFTQSHYANSRYVQSGGYSGSAYASRGSSSPGVARGSPSWESNSNSNGAGKRFGRQPGAAPSGQRFGRQSGGFRAPSGRGFGRHR